MNIFVRAVLLVSALSANAFADTPGEVKAGGYLRDVTLHNFDGTASQFSDYKGKPLLINIWASWCGPCRSEMGSLDRLAHRYDGKAFNMIGISTDDDAAAAASFIEQSGIKFENFLDRRLILEQMLGANSIPLTVLVDTDGRVLQKVRGAQQWDSEKAVSYIEKHFGLELNPEPTPQPATDPMFGLRILNL